MKIFKLQFFLEYEGDYEIVFTHNLATKEIFEADVKKIANSYIDSVIAAKKFTVNLHLMYNAICEQLPEFGYVQFEIDTVKIVDQDLEFSEKKTKNYTNVFLAKFCPDKLDKISEYNKEVYFQHKQKGEKLLEIKKEIRSLVEGDAVSDIVKKYSYCVWDDEQLFKYIRIYSTLFNFYGDERFHMCILEELNEILERERESGFDNDKDKEECYFAIEFLLNTK